MPPAEPTRPRDEAIDARRYLAALRRNTVLIVTIVALITAAAIVFSLLATKTYEASTEVIVPPTASAFAAADAESIQRQLATVQTLITSPAVLQVATRRVRRSPSELLDAVSSELDPTANLIMITATAGTAVGAAQTADGITAAFLENQSRADADTLRRSQVQLGAQIEALQRRSDASSPTIAGQIRALQQRAGDLAVAQANAGSNLQLARGAEVPDGPASPRPVRNAILALFLGIFVAVLAALGRDQLRPGVNGPRDISETLGLPVLGSIPEKPGRLRARRAALLNRVEHESYRTLAGALRLQLGDQPEQLITVTSALHAEGKTSVVTQLSRLLAESGHPTLVISADMRWPRLDTVLELVGREGLSNLLSIASDGGSVTTELLRDRIVAGANRRADVLPAGTILGDGAAAILTVENLATVFDAMGGLGYRYVIVDSPPMLGLGDTQVIASQSDVILVVARMKGLSFENLDDMRRTLDRVQTEPAGVVVIGGTPTASPYFTAPPVQSA